MSEAIASKIIARRMHMKLLQTKLPFRARAVLLAGLFCLVAGAGLVSYRLYLRPTTLTIAVGAFDGEAKQIASTIAGRLATVLGIAFP